MNNLASKQHQSHQILISLYKLEMWVYAMAQDFLQHAQHQIEMAAGSIPSHGQAPYKSRDRNLLGNTNTSLHLLILS
jgi:hypothetical protein